MSLPTELKLLIIQQLDRSSRANLRAVCRSFASITTSCLFEDAKFKSLASGAIDVPRHVATLITSGTESSEIVKRLRQKRKLNEHTKTISLCPDEDLTKWTLAQVCNMIT